MENNLAKVHVRDYFDHNRISKICANASRTVLRAEHIHSLLTAH